MSHYTLDELIELWRREKLTTEQMIGQILQVLKAHEQRMRGGWTRLIQRRAMAGVLPDEIRWRRDKVIPIQSVSRAPMDPLLASALVGYAPSPARFDEAVDESGAVRPIWRNLVATLSRLGGAEKQDLAADADDVDVAVVAERQRRDGLQAGAARAALLAGLDVAQDLADAPDDEDDDDQAEHRGHQPAAGAAHSQRGPAGEAARHRHQCGRHQTV